MSPSDEQGIDLSEKFPDMTPIQSVPTMGSFFLFGLGMHGTRDIDQETGTFVKTHCFSVLGIPVFALGAYRMAVADDTVYMLGRHPLSALVKAWNALLVSGILTAVGLFFWNAHTKSPDYIAAKKLTEADALVEAGELAKAATLYREVAFGTSSHASAGREKFQTLLEGLETEATPQTAAEVLQIACEKNPQDQRILDDEEGLNLGMKLADKFSGTDPRGALAVLNAVAPLAEGTDAGPLTAKRQGLLETLVRNEPNDVDALSQLAVIYESQGKLDECETLLAPHRERLGILEGARVLGQIYSQRGEHEQAVALLFPYAEGRLKNLHAAETALTDAIETLQTRLIQEIEDGKAPSWLYERARNADQEKQDTIVWDYVQSKMKEDQDIFQKQEALRKETPVVPVALDLGISLLQRAQGLDDPEERRAELEQAEKVFLSIRGVAGETNEYRLSLGQVYYWLGKHDEGRKLFDELLEANNRDFTLLIGVSNTLRNVGSFPEARALSEEAYHKAKNEEEKHRAASLRAITSIDNEDSILWLKRSNQSIPYIQAELESALATQAIQDGNDQEAIKHLRKSIDIYAKQTESEGSLNNAALAYFTLYRLTGDAKVLEEVTQLAEKALAINPSNSILLYNTASAILEGALRNVIGDAVDFDALKSGANISLLSYLHEDDQDRKAYVERLLADPGMAKALSYLERNLVLAPKRADTYQTIASIHEYTRNVQALKDLLRRLEEANPDLSDEIRESHEFYRGANDAILQKSLDSSIARSQAKLAEIQQESKATVAYAKATLVTQWISASFFDRAVDADRVVTLAEEAYAAAPSSSTQSTLVYALCFRAGQALAEQQPAYAELFSKTKRSLGHSYLLAAVLENGGPLREAVLAHPDIQRAGTLLVESLNRFPDEYGSWDWAFLRHVQPDAASQLAEIIRQNEVLQLKEQIDLRLSPASGTQAYTSAWLLEIAGKQAEAQEVLRRCAEAKVPLPFMPE